LNNDRDHLTWAKLIPKELAVGQCHASTQWSGHYGCENAYGALDRSWATAHQGVGSWIQYSFNLKTTITSIQFKNRDCGLSDCGDSRSATLQFSDGSTQTVQFDDRNGLNDIKLQPVETTFVKMTITSVYSTVDNGAQILKFFGLQSFLPPNVVRKMTVQRLLKFNFFGRRKLNGQASRLL